MNNDCHIYLNQKSYTSLLLFDWVRAMNAIYGGYINMKLSRMHFHIDVMLDVL